ncbi:MAG: ABC transporter permease [Holophagales bacterium]|nr:MAG: ABC transporter permease [Holophagales bacterium]
MRIRVLLATALRSLGRNRLRSFLTMLGVIIGVASVIAMVSIGRGAQRRVESQIAALGKNLLTVFSGSAQLGGARGGAGSISTLTMDDVARLRDEAETLAYVSPLVRAPGQVVGGGSNWASQVLGVSPEYFAIREWTVADGEAFGDREMRTGAKVALLGRTVATNLFGESSPVGAQIRIGRVPFTVVGVLSPKGQTGFGTDQDDIVLAPATTVQSRLAGGRNLNQIYVSVREGVSSAVAQAEVEEVMRRSHRLADGEESDFNIRSQAEIATAAAATTQTFTLLLGSIAGVSLLVGGIGIMNILLVSVTERTREIGIRLAVGARTRDVLLQFLIEAVVLSLAGGAIGAVLGVAGALAIGRSGRLQAVVEPSTVAIAMLFAAAVGLFFGLHPARRASRLDPIEALRYE